MKMEIKKGQKLNIVHARKGVFKAVALQDFDTEKEEWYPVATFEYVEGMANDWLPGETISCRNTLCRKIEVAE